jgi:hypothetical protein
LAIHYCCNRFTAPQRIGAGEFLIELDDFFISRQYFNRALQFLLVASADCRLVLHVLFEWGHLFPADDDPRLHIYA